MAAVTISSDSGAQEKSATVPTFSPSPWRHPFHMKRRESVSWVGLPSYLQGPRQEDKCRSQSKCQRLKLHFFKVFFFPMWIIFKGYLFAHWVLVVACRVFFASGWIFSVHIWPLCLWNTGSEAHGLGRSTACGVLVPQSGIKPASTALQDDSLSLGRWRSPWSFIN